MRIVKRILGILIGIALVLFVIYKLGPKPRALRWPAEINSEIIEATPQLSDINDYVQEQNSQVKLKLGNGSLLYWGDSIGKQTEYVLLYLHGFSASPMEGSPVHSTIAEKYGMNMYVPRLAAHGLDEAENMIDFTAEKYLISTQEALAIAQKLGKKVILMTTSTGSTAGLYLTSSKENNIAGLICYSPNIKVFDPKASLLAGPWGIEIARLVKGGNYHTWDAPEGAEQYWHTKYRLEALVELQRLIEGTMTPAVFEDVVVPTFVGYYYKNEVEQDSVVSVKAIKEMYEHLGSDHKKLVVFPDAGKHCMPSKYFGQDIEGLIRETSRFLEIEFGL